MRKRQKISDRLRRMMLEESRNRCCICHEYGEVDVHHMVPQAEGGQTIYDNLIVVCPSCHRMCHASCLPARRLQAIKDAWLHYCVSSSEDKLQSDVEAALTEARRLSLSLNLLDLRRARCLAEIIVYQMDPLNVEARLLYEQLIEAEKREEAALERAQHDFRVYLDTRTHRIALVLAACIYWGYALYDWWSHGVISFLWNVLQYPVVIFIVWFLSVLAHEIGHLQGYRMAFKKEFSQFGLKPPPLYKLIRYINWGGVLTPAGIFKVIFKCRSPDITINIDRMHRELLTPRFLESKQ
jgi:hypothetical protein